MNKKRMLRFAILAGLTALIGVGCSKAKKSSTESSPEPTGEITSPTEQETTSAAAPDEVQSPTPDVTAAGTPTATPDETQAPTATPGETQAPTDTPDETQAPTDTAQPTPTPEIVSGFVDEIPLQDGLPLASGGGRIVKISYPSKDYFGDGSDLEKPAFVYLPEGYDETKQYNVLYLMHGIGGNEREWGMVGSTSKVKAIMDRLTQSGAIEPFIIVAPNGRSGSDFANTNADYNAFYKFGQELRNDLIPYIDAHYATYADYDENGYDLTAARDHRAMAGLSMGGMQTTNIGMCECLDILSYFGAFSAAPTTYTASKISACLKNFPQYDIHYYYAICGLQDGIALSSASAAVNNLTALTDKLTDEDNFHWQKVPGGHDFNIWYLGFYNFARIVFR